MTKIIDVLEQIGSDASLNNDNINNFVMTADISDNQKKAILARDAKYLATTISDLPEIKCFAVLPAENDDQEDDNQEDADSDTSNHLAITMIVNG